MDNIPPKHLIEGAFLGSGGFGDVRLGRYIGTPVAVKTLYDSDAENNILFFREVEVLKRLTHPNIVSIITYDSKRIVLELYDSSLRNIKNKEEMCLVARDCMRAISFMHSHENFCMRHRDIKPDNILIKYDKSGAIHRAALGDFGLATTCASKNVGGTRGFMPLIKQSSDRMHDIFALAVSILDAIFKESVHGAKGRYETIKDYPPPGNSPQSRNNTMYYANQLLPQYQVVMSKMLVLVYMPGDTEEEKTEIVKKILEEWEFLYKSLHLSDKITRSPMKRLFNRFKKGSGVDN